MNLQKLIEKYPDTWAKTCEKYQDEEVRKNAFLAEVYKKIAKQKERELRELERKRRTRALIIFSSEIIKRLASGELKLAIRDGDKYRGISFEEVLKLLDLTKTERKKRTDYAPYLLEEYKKHATAS